MLTAEEERLAAASDGSAAWRRWGPYVSERQWGTVREDYSAEGTPWEYFPHDHARSRAYRWGEDGIAGICDDRQRLCFALALWNDADPILKERLFGLTGHEGNHGEDVKEYYFYLDNVPSHAYMKMLYKYPQRPILRGSRGREPAADEERSRVRAHRHRRLRRRPLLRRVRRIREGGPNDIFVRIRAANRGPDAAPLQLLPTLWFRNDWSWYRDKPKPRIEIDRESASGLVLSATSREGKAFRLYSEAPDAALFADNETNTTRHEGCVGTAQYAKDAFDRYVVHGIEDAVNPARHGTKAAPLFRRRVAAGETVELRLRLTSATAPLDDPLATGFDALFDLRRQEADDFYARVTPFELPEDMRNVQRRAFAGMLWNKQHYHYSVHRWPCDPVGPPPPDARQQGRNRDWPHFAASDILSMPDKWEYPWFAAWDTAFHVVALAMIDPEFAKDQLLLLMREWYMHPNGQIPAYEWKFGDVNPPVHAWAAIRVYQIEGKIYGRNDRAFLARAFQKLLINFTWWVNRKDSEGNNIFEGGFLGLDNIGAFDRSSGLPSGGRLEQADGTSWMATYCLNLLAISLELAREDPVYEDVATKFFEHFVYIGAAVNRVGGREGGLWHDEEGFYYDALKLPDGRCFPIRANTVAGLIPLLAIAVGDRDSLRLFRGFGQRLQWFLKYREDLLEGIADLTHRGMEERLRLALVDSSKLRRILRLMLDEERFLSPHGLRSLSKRHATEPFVLALDGQRFVLDYEPGESTTPLFGGNSNWRGPVWFPINFLLIEALQKHHYFHGDEFKVECPSGSGRESTLWEVTTELTRRLIGLFVRDENGRRPVNGDRRKFDEDPHWKDLVFFHEYFHGDTGAGLGASHQTGWTGLVAKLIAQYGEYALQA
jgi:hypothetical protein